MTGRGRVRRLGSRVVPSSAGRLICRGGCAAGFDRGELSEDPAKVGGSVSDLDECSAGRADGSKGNAVAVAEEVGGDGAGTPHRPIEAAGRSVDPTTGTGVDGCVDDEQDVGVAVGMGGGDVEGAGSQRDGPVDSSEAIPDRERSDRGELRAVTATPRSVQADQAGRAGHGRGAVEDGRQRQGRELRQRAGSSVRIGMRRRSRSPRPVPGRSGGGPIAVIGDRCRG